MIKSGEKVALFHLTKYDKLGYNRKRSKYTQKAKTVEKPLLLYCVDNSNLQEDLCVIIVMLHHWSEKSPSR